jgi:hypothetical protein
VKPSRRISFCKVQFPGVTFIPSVQKLQFGNPPASCDLLVIAATWKQSVSRKLVQAGRAPLIGGLREVLVPAADTVERLWCSGAHDLIDLRSKLGASFQAAHPEQLPQCAWAVAVAMPLLPRASWSPLLNRHQQE